MTKNILLYGLTVFIVTVYSCVENKHVDINKIIASNNHLKCEVVINEDKDSLLWCFDFLDENKRTTRHVFYFLNGQISHISELRDSLKEGIHKQYYRSGILEYEALYIDNQLDGFANAFHENGFLDCSLNYRKGKIQGFRRCFSDQGRLTKEYYFHNNLMLLEYDVIMDSIITVRPKVHFTENSIKVNEGNHLIIEVPYIDLNYFQKDRYTLYFDIYLAKEFYKQKEENELSLPKHKMNLNKEVQVFSMTILEPGKYVFVGAIVDEKNDFFSDTTFNAEAIISNTPLYEIEVTE